MKRLTINLTGTVSYFASRSFVIEVPDDVNISTIDREVLETLADDAKIAWDFNAEGYVQTTDHFIDEASDSDQGNLVVIQLEEKSSV